MKYSNLTSQEKILKWFALYPSTINNICPVDGHIFDWICNGYRGKDSAKTNLAIELIKRSANLSLVKIQTFYYFIEKYVCTHVEKNLDSSLVLDIILKEETKINDLKGNFYFYNKLVEKYPFSKHEFENIHEKILFTNIPEFKLDNVKQENNQIKYNNYPITFLLDTYLSNLNDLKPKLSVNFNKINKIHRLNKTLILSEIPFCSQLSPSDLKYFSISPKDTISNALEKISILLREKNMVENSITTEIAEIINRDLERSLNCKLSSKEIRENKSKI